MLEMFARTPVWVWFILAGLIVIGLLLTRNRSAGAARLVLPSAAMSIYSLVGVWTAFPNNGWAMVAWLAGFSMGLAAFRPNWRAALRRLRVNRAERLSVAGSWVPFGLFMGIFGIRYAINVIHAVAPALLTDLRFIVAFAIALGALSGLLLGRALREIGRER